MPKYSEEMEEKIITLIEQGYKNAEISRELDIYRGAVAKRRKAYEKRRQNQEKPEPEPEQTVQQEQTDPHPLDPQIYTLIRYQGTHSREEALSQAIETQHNFNPYILNHGFETPKELIKFFEDKIQLEFDNVKDLKIDSDISQSLIADYKETITQLKAEEDAQYEEGYEKGKNDHAILVPCISCGESITILPGTEAHTLIVRLLRENYGIIHTDCKPSYQRVYAR